MKADWRNAKKSPDCSSCDMQENGRDILVVLIFRKAASSMRPEYLLSAAFLQTFSTVAAAVADQFAAAGLAVCAEIRHIQLFLRDGIAPVVHQIKTHGLAFEVHAGLVGHPALQLLAGQVVAFTVFDEHSAGLDKAECYVGIHAFLTERFDPIKIAGAGTIVVFAAADDLLDLPGGQILPDAHRPDEGRAHNTLVLEGQAEQNRNALVGTALIFTGDVEKDVVPSAAPVRRQALSYPLRPLGEQKKHHIAALAHDVPRFRPPRVGLFQKEIGRHAHPDLLAALNFVVSGAVFLERVGKAIFRFVDLGPILIPHPVKKIHITVLAALAALDAAVPWIPDVVQEAHLLSVPIIIIAARTGNKSTPCTAPPDVIG